MNKPTQKFNMHWQADEPTYRNVLDYARACLRRVPTMDDLTLGRNVKDEVRRWCADGAASVLGWGPVNGYRWVIDPRVLSMLADEVGDFNQVNEEAVGEAVLGALAIEE